MNRRHIKVGLPIVTALIACLIGYGTYTRLDIDNFNSVSAKVHQANPGTLRDTVNGPVIGFSDSNDTFGWTGIPYAAPPLGDLRWRAPQPIADWQETLPVIEPGIACTQIWTFLAAEKGAKGDIVGSEDCLTLNVWSPQRLSADPSTTDAKLPVMVWIHGGGNSVGS
jgi:para-nitrobenzyl esterase